VGHTPRRSAVRNRSRAYEFGFVGVPTSAHVGPQQCRGTYAAHDSLHPIAGSREVERTPGGGATVRSWRSFGLLPPRNLGGDRRIEAKTLLRSGDRESLAAFERSAQVGDLVAQIALAKSCFDDQPPRKAEGMRWLLVAAEQGSARAQLVYGQQLLAQHGKLAGDEAVEWFTRAAGQGYGIAQCSLGLILYDGQYVPQDKVSAAQWLLLARRNGGPLEQRAFEEVEPFLSPDELTEARKRADAFQPARPKVLSPNDEKSTAPR